MKRMITLTLMGLAVSAIVLVIPGYSADTSGDLQDDNIVLDYTCGIALFWAIPNTSPILEMGMRFTNPGSEWCHLESVTVLLYNKPDVLTDTTGDLQINLYEMDNGYPFGSPLVSETIDNDDFVQDFNGQMFAEVSVSLPLFYDEAAFSTGEEWFVGVTTASAESGDTLLFLTDDGSCPQQRLLFNDGFGPFKYAFIDWPVDYNMHIYCEIDTSLVYGDANQSGEVDIDDVVYLISFIFGGPPPPTVSLILCDADCGGGVDIDDVVYLIEYIFALGPEPCSP